MEVNITLIRREFHFEGKVYSDPNPTFSVQRVQGFLANENPPILNAKVVSDNIKGNKRIIELKKNPGTHG
jgi:PRTRC genetic system protein C